jgi:plastocyanin
MRACTALALLIPLAAGCGGDSTPGGTPDAAMADAAAASVRTVTCPPGQVPTVTTSDANLTTYTPASTTISAGGIVKFMMSTTHNVAPNPIRATDPGLVVDYGATACLEFSKAGTFSFRCSTHSFAGMIVVQ